MATHLDIKLLLTWSLAAIVWLLVVARMAGAQTPPVGRDNVVLEGYIQCPTANDPAYPCIFGLHYIDLTAGRTYEIRMESSDFYPRLILENLAGKQLGIDTDYYDQLDGSIVFRAPATDSYRLIANAVMPSHGGHYTITVRELPVLMQVDATVAGGRTVAKEMTLTAGRRYVIDLQSPQFDTFVRLLNADGAIVAFEDEGNGSTPARVVFVPRRTETYRIVAAASMPTESGPLTLQVCEQ